VINDLVDRDSGNDPISYNVKRATEEYLLRLSDMEFFDPGSRLYFSFMQVTEPELQYLVIKWIMSPASGPDALAAMLAEAKTDDESAQLVKTIAGTGVRRQTSLKELSFYVPVPESEQCLELQFVGKRSLTSGQINRFTLIATSLRWVT
jgi:hypothetical protein